MKNLLKTAISVLVAGTISLSPVSALGTADSRATARDWNTHSTVPGNFDVQYVNYQEFRNDDKYHYFFAYMASNLVADQFNDGSDAWVGLIIDADLDGESDYQIEFSDKNLSTSLSTFRAYKKMRGDWQSIDKCDGGTYMSASSGDLTETNRFLAFKVSVSCLNLPSIFQFLFYLDANGDGERWGVELGPDNFFQVSNALLDRTRNFRVVPGMVARSQFANPNPSDSAAMSVETAVGQRKARGVVQIKCFGTVRHGWVPEGDVPYALEVAGFKSLVVTTYSSIESCMGERWVVVSAHTGEVTEGLITNWDYQNNLAVIAIAPKLDGLRWQGQTPREGWAATVISDVRKVSPTSSPTVIKSLSARELILSPAIKPGSDGLPVFDSQGGVIGIMSYKGGLAQNTAVAIPATLLCSGLFSCPGVQVWRDNPPALPTTAELRVSTSTFAAKSTTWNSANKKSLTTQFANVNPTSIVCTGYFPTQGSSADKSLALRRAQAVCASLRAATSAIVVTAGTSKAPVSSERNKVRVSAKYVPEY